MIGLLAIAIPLAVYEFGGMGTGTSAAAPPATSSTSSNSGAQKKSGGVLAANNLLDPTLHTAMLDASRRVKYEAGGRNIFRMEEPPIPKVIATVKATPPPIATPTPVPPPPPIPLKFYGFASKSNEPKKVFLAEGPSIFVARQGEIVDRRYKVVQIQNNSVTVEDLLTNNRQPIPLTAR